MPKHDPDLTAEQQVKLTLLANIGTYTGGQIVKALRSHAPCECLGCQMIVLESAIQWALQGHDAREAKRQIDMLIVDMLEVRKEIKGFIAYAQACEDAGLNPDTFASTQGNA